MRVYDRESKKYLEIKQYKDSYLSFLYNNVFGRVLLKIVINPIFSKINGFYNNTSLSKKKIKKFIYDNNIDMSIFENEDYHSFNDFFARKIKPECRVISNDNNELISPADSKLLVYKISEDLKLKIKGSVYSLEELVDNKIKLSEFKNGICLVFRLSMDNYHRYCYIDDGKLLDSFSVKGKLHTVSSISSKYKIYKENSRVINNLLTNNLGNIIQIEVGALLVGKIVNTPQLKFNRGVEKGYFKLGGSTIVILLKDKTVKIDKDIIEQNKKGIEVMVKYGERIGRRI